MRTFWLGLIGPLVLITIEADNDKQYGMINRVLTECEYDAMTIGSKLGDTFHSFDEKTAIAECLTSDYLFENLGFVSHMNYNANGKGKQNGWTNCSKVSQCKYWSLEDRWVHILGDSKAHQIWETFVGPLLEKKTSYQEYASERCTKQNHTSRNMPPGYRFDFGNGSDIFARFLYFGLVCV